MTKVIVTDHAIIRYIERRRGIDLQFIRNEIASEVESAIRAGAVSYFDGEATYHLAGNKVVTIVEGHSRADMRCVPFGSAR